MVEKAISYSCCQVSAMFVACSICEFCAASKRTLRAGLRMVVKRIRMIAALYVGSAGLFQFAIVKNFRVHGTRISPAIV